MKVLNLLLVVFLAACASPGVTNGSLSGEARHVGDPRVKSVVELTNERVAFGNSDLAIYQCEILNKTNKDARVEYRARWYDEDGIELNDAAGAWTPVFLPGGSSNPVRSTARNMRGVRCVLEVRMHG